MCYVDRRYLHSKGISRHISQPNETPNVRMWRWVMEYHLLARWKGCMQLLEDHDAVGKLLPPPSKTMRDARNPTCHVSQPYKTVELQCMTAVFEASVHELVAGVCASLVTATSIH